MLHGEVCHLRWNEGEGAPWTMLSLLHNQGEIKTPDDRRLHDQSWTNVMREGGLSYQHERLPEKAKGMIRISKLQFDVASIRSVHVSTEISG